MTKLLLMLDIILPIATITLFLTGSGPEHLWIIIAAIYTIVCAVHIVTAAANRFPYRPLYLTGTIIFVLDTGVMWTMLYKDMFITAFLILTSLLIVLFQTHRKTL